MRTVAIEAELPLPAPPAFGGSDGSPLSPPLLTMSMEVDDAPSMFRRDPPPYSRAATRTGTQRVTIELPAVYDEFDAPTVATPRSASALVEDAVDALLRRDHDAALSAYLDAQRLLPNDRTIAANVERLQLLLRRVDDERDATRRLANR